MKRKINIDINFESEKKIFIITRISTEKKDENSLIDQKDSICEKYRLNMFDHKVITEYIPFNGYSAFNTSFYTNTMDTLSTLENKEFYLYPIK